MRKAFAFLACALVLFACSGCEHSATSGSNGADQPKSISFDISPQSLVVFNAMNKGNDDLFILDVKTNEIRQLTDTAEYETSPSFSPDGKFILYSAYSKSFDCSNLYIVPSSGGTANQLTFETNAALDTPRFSPDGSQIIFSKSSLRRPYSMGGKVWDDWDFYSMNASGKKVRRLTNQKYYQAYSPDYCSGGTQVVFAVDLGDYQKKRNRFIQAVDLAAKPQAPQSVTDGTDSSCSKDGKKIAYISDQVVAYQYEVWTMNSDGTNQTQVTHNTSYNTNPVFTPDGKHIMFLSDINRNNHTELWQVDSDGKNLRKLAGDKLFSQPLNWKPETIKEK